MHEEVAGSRGDEWKGDVHLKCPEGVEGIKIHVYDTAAKHTADESLCTFVVKPQTVKGIVYKNKTVRTTT